MTPQGNDGTDAPVSVRLTGTDCADEGQSYVIYKSELDDPSRVLACDTRLGISYTSTVELLNDDEGQVESASSPLGSILVDWKPSVLQLPSKVDADSDVFGAFQAHGPLALAAPSTIRFTGPLCYIERAPFEVKQKQSIEPHTVGVPFAVQYSIANTTTLHQVLRFYFIEDGGETNGLSLGNSGLLMSGCKCGFLWLGPMDEQCLSFTFVASRPGQATLPALQVSSDRYQNWVINDGPKGVPVFVFP